MNTLQHPYVAPQRRQQQFHRQQHYCQKEQFNLHMLPFFKKEKKNLQAARETKHTAQQDWDEFIIADLWASQAYQRQL